MRLKVAFPIYHTQDYAHSASRQIKSHFGQGIATFPSNTVNSPIQSYLRWLRYHAVYALFIYWLQELFFYAWILPFAYYL